MNPFYPLSIYLGFSIARAAHNDGNWNPRYEYPFVHFLCEALVYRLSSVA